MNLSHKHRAFPAGKSQTARELLLQSLCKDEFQDFSTTSRQEHDYATCGECINDRDQRIPLAGASSTRVSTTCLVFRWDQTEFFEIRPIKPICKLQLQPKSMSVCPALYLTVLKRGSKYRAQVFRLVASAYFADQIEKLHLHYQG